MKYLALKGGYPPFQMAEGSRSSGPVGGNMAHAPEKMATPTGFEPVFST
jgi:hypothetical protein